jgi:hypothetical protein
MKTKLSALLLPLVLLVLGTSWLVAQDTSSSGKSKSDTRTITGCLTQGDNAKEFKLTGDDGSTWEVRSSSVSLADHVGHKVEATGVVKNSTAHNMKEDTKDMASDAHMTKDNNEHGHMTITDLKMVSHSCQ